MTRMRRQILPSEAGGLWINGWQFPKSCCEFKTRVRAAGAESLMANWVLHKQGWSDWQKQSNSDRGEPSQPYWRYTLFFWSFCQGNGQPVPFRKVSSVCEALTLKWKRNSRQTANLEIHIYSMRFTAAHTIKQTQTALCTSDCIIETQ